VVGDWWLDETNHRPPVTNHHELFLRVKNYNHLHSFKAWSSLDLSVFR
jgi:hypothetical protein